MALLLPYAATRKELRRFSAILAVAFALIGFWGSWHGEKVAVWAVYCGAACLLLGTLAPGIMAPVYRVWMNVGHGLGWINTRIILGLMFVAIICPIGVFRRTIGRTGLQLRPAPELDTYATPSTPRVPEHFNWQF